MVKSYLEFIELVKDINNIRSIEQLLEWDHEVMMPPEGVKDRALQMATISKMSHDLLTSSKMERLLEELNSLKAKNELAPDQLANLREIEWVYHRAATIPSELVSRIAKAKSESYATMDQGQEG